MKKASHKISITHLLIILLLASCSASKYAAKQKEVTISALKFLDEYIMPHNSTYQNTLVGGLSGIDYDAKNDQYFLISDDPSQYSPARVYTAKIDIKEHKIDTIKFTGVTPILQRNGQQYPKYQYGKNSKADGESVRFDPTRNRLVWSNEGERLYRPMDTTIVQPALTFIAPQGNFLDTVPLPKGFEITKQAFGVRKNAFFEGLSYADNYKTLYASLEEPLYQDGREAAFGYGKALTRILKFNVKTKKNTAQYAYNLGELPVHPTAESDWNLNGISEILAINNHTLLVMERAWAKGHDDHTFIKLYLVDLTDAENEIDNKSFVKMPPKPLKKKLLFDFDALNRYIDNFEGVTFGPKLPNGHNTLIFIVDDNFAKNEKGQIFLFEVIP